MNVLLLTIDSLRADRVLRENSLTPTFDELAADGVDCRQAITHGHGTPVAFPAILTGTYPMLYGGCTSLSPERPALARTLRGAGYDTAAFTSNPHLFDKYGYAVGFDDFNQYQDGSDGGAEHHSLIERIRLAVEPHVDTGSTVYDLLRRVYYFLLTTTNERPYAPADEINEKFLDWLDTRDSTAPFFSWVHYMDAHYPFYQDDDTLASIGADSIPVSRQRRLNRLMNENPRRLDTADVEDLTTLYDAEVRFVDHQIAALRDALRERGLLEDTLVVVTSDHGEAFGEHDGFGHYKALYEEIVRVPLLLSIPGETATVEGQVGLADLAPTILDYLDIESDVAADFSGESLRPRIENPDAAAAAGDHRHVVGHGDPLGVRTDRWKYIWWDRDGAEPTDAELFDLHEDPGETEDVSAAHPTVVEEFDAYLADHVEHAQATADALDSAGEQSVDPDIEDQLEALGYK